MLMSMLSDVPAANSSQAANATAYNQSGQVMNSVQNQAKPKPQRKRKLANDPGNKSPVSSAGRSPKRKMSEDDFSRDGIAPSSDLIESFSENHVPNYSKNLPSNVPAPSGHELTFSNASRSLDSLLVGSRTDPGQGNCVQNLNPNDPTLGVVSNHQVYNVGELLTVLSKISSEVVLFVSNLYPSLIKYGSLLSSEKVYSLVTTNLNRLRLD